MIAVASVLACIAVVVVERASKSFHVRRLQRAHRRDRRQMYWAGYRRAMLFPTIKD